MAQTAFDRRETITRLAALTGMVALAARARPVHAALGPASAELPDWLRRADALTAMLRGEAISVADWREGLERLFADISVADIARDTDFERLRAGTGFAEKGIAPVTVNLATDTIRRLTFHPKIFALGRGRAVIPHGHAGMVSAHLTLTGAIHLRQYDQLSRNAEALVIRPSVDRTTFPGDLASIGPVRDNVHWLVAEAPSHTLDMIVTDLDDTLDREYAIYNLDIDAAVAQADGTLVAPRMEAGDALEKYG